MALWTPIYHNVLDKPELIRLAAALEVDLYKALGYVVAFWCWCDAHCKPVESDDADPNEADGFAEGVTPEVIDVTLRRAPGATSVALALEQVGWARFTPEGLTVPRFTKHMGGVAKERAKNTKRQAAVRARKAGSSPGVAPGARQERDDGRAQDETPARRTSRPTRDNGRAGSATTEHNSTEREETAAASPVGAAPCENPNGPGGDAAAAADFSDPVEGELTAGEAERDGAPDPHGWRARFTAMGLDDPVALATAAMPEEASRMAYIAERFEAERGGIGNPGGWLRKLILTGASPPDGWRPAAEREADAGAKDAALRAPWDAMLALPPDEIEAINDELRGCGCGWFGGVPERPTDVQLVRVKQAMSTRTHPAGAAS